MKQFKIMIFIVIISVTALLASTILIIKNSSIENVDTVAINEIMQESTKNFNNLHNLDKMNFKYNFIILDSEENILYSKGTTSYSSLSNTIKQRNLILDLTIQNKKTGTLIVFTNTNDYINILLNNICKLISISCILILIIITIYFYSLYKNILKPFNDLQNFAHQISTGNLDVPLLMDKNNIFGNFTSSFDIMRQELNKAKEKEYLANKSKKELVASLSHDIKTPVTSIKLVSELLLAMIKDEKYKTKLSLIYNKADEIDHLITDMFNSTLEELSQLKFNITDEYSSLLKNIFINADYNNKVKLSKIPDCAIKIDILRFQQVINNVITNSYKYADTQINVTFTLEKYNLKINIKDYGQGVSDDEIELIFNKFYRGKSPLVKKQNGSGLGLYISKYIMNEMGGDICCFNESDGFNVEILIQLL